MRPLRFATLVVLLALPAFAANPPAAAPQDSEHMDAHCDVTVGPHDRLAREGDLVIRPGEVVEDAIALHGNVILKPGAKVSGSALALDGSVALESGAQVGKSAVAFNGHVRVDVSAKVVGSSLSLSKGTFALRGDDGNQLTLDFSSDPDSFGRKIVDEVLHGVRACRIDAQQRANR